MFSKKRRTCLQITVFFFPCRDSDLCDVRHADKPCILKRERERERERESERQREKEREREREKLESCRENLLNEIQLKGPQRQK